MIRKLAYSVSSREQWVFAAGGFAGILAVLAVSHQMLAGHAAYFVASMGASAVMLFAAPHGPLSQPWALIGGHLVSAAAGVTVARLVADPTLAAALAIGLMYGLRCLHPPGRATALFAVLGGESIHALGYGYLRVPVPLNAVTLLIVAGLFNYLFAWRRYPQAWMKEAAETVCAVQPEAHPKKA